MTVDKMLKYAVGVFKYIFPFLAVIILWQTLASLHIFPDYLFPYPMTVLEDFFSKAIHSNTLLFHLKESLIRLFFGYITGIMLGLVTGLAMGIIKPVRTFLEPLFEFGHAVPGVCWLPMAILWLGINFKTLIFIIFLIVFFPVLNGTLAGVKATSIKFYNVSLMCGAKKRQIILYTLLPGAMPSIISGIRTGAAFGWRGLVAAEMIASSSGLGWMIIDARSWLNTETIILGAIVIGTIGLCIDRLLLKRLENATIKKWGLIHM